MKGKKAFIFLLLVLPNVVFAQGFTTAVSGLIGTYMSYAFPGIFSSSAGVVSGLVGVICAPQFDLAEDGEIEADHEQNSTEELKKHANTASTYTCALVGIGLGLSGGWMVGSSMIEIIKYCL